MNAPPDIPHAAYLVIGRLSRVPWVWDVILEELEECRARKAHFRLRLDILGTFGSAVNAIVDLRRKRRKPTPLDNRAP